jgi:unsaturated pyranuronate lyase
MLAPFRLSRGGAYESGQPTPTLHRVDVHRWADEPIEQLSAEIGRQMLNGDGMTLARITLAAGAVVPEHHHENEQIATVVSGRVRFVVADDEHDVGAGESVLIRRNVPHRVEALEESVVLDVFAPPREDWIRGDDAYLRR